MRPAYRISVKREDHGVVSRWLHAHIQPGSVIEAAAPRGDFYLIEADSPVVLISAGIGVTPVLAMLHALSAAHSQRDIWWLHTTRNRETQVFATEVTTLIESLPNARQQVFYTKHKAAWTERPSRRWACRPTLTSTFAVQRNS